MKYSVTMTDRHHDTKSTVEYYEYADAETVFNIECAAVDSGSVPAVTVSIVREDGTVVRQGGVIWAGGLWTVTTHYLRGGHEHEHKREFLTAVQAHDEYLRETERAITLSHYAPCRVTLIKGKWTKASLTRNAPEL